MQFLVPFRCVFSVEDMVVDPILGSIMLWPVPWIPEGWMACDGRLLPVQQYEALFSLLNNTYGGDGMKTFGLPDLRGQAPVAKGAAPTALSYAIAVVGVYPMRP